MLKKNITTNDKLEKFGLKTLSKIKKDVFKIESYSTGSYLLDEALNIGGLPQGKIVEIYGNDSSGKSTLACHIIAQNQKNNKTCVYLDLENTFNATWARTIGVDIDSLYIASPENGEATFTLLNELSKDNSTDIIIVDSVTAMVPNYEYQNQIEDQTMGMHARLMSKGLRILQGLLISSKTTIIFINQLREKIGFNNYGVTTITTGGRALRYCSSVRIEIKKTESIKHAEKIVGFLTKAVIIKNKYGSPMKEALLGLYFDSGFNQTHEFVNAAIKKNIIAKKGAWFSYKEKNLAQGMIGIIKYLEKNPEVLDEIKSQI